MSSANPTNTPAAFDHTRLAHFPVALFSTVMGSAGLAIAWHKAAQLLGWPAIVGQALTVLASGLFVLLCALYGLKAMRHPDAVAAERRHPVKMNFFPTISIGILLLAIAWHGAAPEAARGRPMAVDAGCRAAPGFHADGHEQLDPPHPL